MDNKNHLIIDCSNIIHSVFYTVGSLSYDGKPTGIIDGFLKRILAFSKKYKTNKLYFCFDSKYSEREKIYPEYKKNRKKRLNKLSAYEYEQYIYMKKQEKELYKSILFQIGFRNITIRYGFEADDIMAIYANKLYSQNKKCIIISSDADMFQCLNKCDIFNPTTKKRVTKKILLKEYGVTPEQWPVCKAIAGCFDKKTELLTNRGWIFFKDIKKEDLVYSANPETMEARYEKIIDIIKYKYNGKMFKIKGRLIDLLVTPDHELFGNTTQLYNPKRNKVKFYKIEDIVKKYKNFSIPIVSKWLNKEKKEFFILKEYTSNYNMPNGGISNIIKKELKIPMKDWIAFLGIYLADGFVSKNRNGKIGIIGICKIKKEKRKKIKKQIEKLPFIWGEIKYGFQTNSVQLANYLHKIGDVYEKYIPQEIKDLNIEYLEILIKWMIHGDGCISKGKCSYNNKRYEKKSYYTCSKKLADDFQEIAIKCGYSTNLSIRKERKWKIKGKEGISKKQYIVRINKSKTVNLKSKINIVKDFNDYVYDITTEPFHTILVRRNGNVVWSSNCSSDEIKGIRGVADPKNKTSKVLKYMNNRLNHGKIFDRINSKKGFDIIERNLPLVTLPYNPNKIGPILLKRDKITKNKLVKVFGLYNFQSFFKEDIFKDWEECFLK